MCIIVHLDGDPFYTNGGLLQIATAQGFWQTRSDGLDLKGDQPDSNWHGAAGLQVCKTALSLPQIPQIPKSRGGPRLWQELQLWKAREGIGLRLPLPVLDWMDSKLRAMLRAGRHLTFSKLDQWFLLYVSPYVGKEQSSSPFPFLYCFLIFSLFPGVREE